MWTLDDVLFPGYRSIDLKGSVFIVGVFCFFGLLGPLALLGMGWGLRFGLGFWPCCLPSGWGGETAGHLHKPCIVCIVCGLQAYTARPPRRDTTRSMCRHLFYCINDTPTHTHTHPTTHTPPSLP